MPDVTEDQLREIIIQRNIRDRQMGSSARNSLVTWEMLFYMRVRQISISSFSLHKILALYLNTITLHLKSPLGRIQSAARRRLSNDQPVTRPIRSSFPSTDHREFSRLISGEWDVGVRWKASGVTPVLIRIDLPGILRTLESAGREEAENNIRFMRLPRGSLCILFDK